jgi:flagellar biosynthesis/type III secretory pathway M-ring protein FliF/YscJ
MDSKNSNQNEKGTNKFSDFTGKVKSQWNGLSKTKKIITGVAGLAIVGVAGVAVYQATTGTTVTSCCDW